MKLAKYRVRSGHYRVGDWNIYGGSRIRWQVRDELDDLVEDFATLREALRYVFAVRAVAKAKNARTVELPTHPAELARMLHN